MHHVSKMMCWGYGTEEHPPLDGNYNISRMRVVTSKVLECEVTIPTTAFQFGVPNAHPFPISLEETFHLNGHGGGGNPFAL